MNTFENLSKADQTEFLKFPAYISLLAANRDGVTDGEEIKAAIDFEHIKTYTCNPLLAGFYERADLVFKASLVELDNELPKGKTERDIAIAAKLGILENLLSKFDKVYAATMHQSMKSFSQHVSDAHRSFLESFIFPVPIKGLTD